MDNQQEYRDTTSRTTTLEKEWNTNIDFILKRNIFWEPTYLAHSAWLEHIPFAFWLVDVLQPRNIVELGTHDGSSYFSFCQAVANLEFDTQCFAINTWSEEGNNSVDSEKLYSQVSNYNQDNYSSFSKLIISNPEDALENFEKESIDLLHINGLYTVDAIHHVFESWLPKLSQKAVVIIHDTNTRKRGNGVFRFFNELKVLYPHFEFSHGNGLGVVGVGNKQNVTMQALYALASKPSILLQVKEIFSRLGKACSDSRAKLELKQEIERLVREYKEAQLYAQEQHALERGHITTLLNSQHQEIEALQIKLAQYQEREKMLEAKHIALKSLYADLDNKLAEAKTHQARLAQERDLAVDAQRQLEADYAVLSQKRAQALEHKLDAQQSALTTLQADLAAQARRLTEAKAHQARLVQERDMALHLQHQLEATNTKLSQQLAQTLEQIRKSGQAQTVLQGERDTWVTQFKQIERDLVDSHQRLHASEQRHKDELTQLQQQVSALTDQRIVLEANIAERFNELAAITRHAENLTRELESKEKQLVQAKERAQRLKKSVSWKLTAPVRAIVRPFKKKNESNVVAKSAIELIVNSGLFDESWYREHYPEVANSSLSALEHYLEVGAEQGYNPSPVFDTSWYINTYPDVAQSAINPLLHYIMHGQAEQRNCLPKT
ncbi:class I SAM-dependent methyltransferase [Aeromonas sp. 602200]|uniref:class I SAM-dependent methyltransferase n=1 Tax=Aeromonas sp. 602200 TaxID=2712040 RepID=UPI0038EFF6F5